MATVDLPQILPYQPIRMSVERYHQLLKVGAFSEHDEVELLDGVVTEKMSKNPPHRIATRRCDLAFARIVPSGWHVQNQEPITLQKSEPEPDVAIVRGVLEDYAERHPGLKEVALVVEVADTSLVTDRFKAQIYAAAEIPTYWIINLVERVIEVMDQPSGKTTSSSYSRTRRFFPGDEIPVEILGDQIAMLPVDELIS